MHQKNIIKKQVIYNYKKKNVIINFKIIIIFFRQLYFVFSVKTIH